MSRRERRALALLLGLAVAGHLIRAVRAAPEATPPAIAVVDSAGDADPLAHLDSTRRLAAPLRPGERIDVDQASAEELTRLPGVGMALARRIVADRESRGAFRGIPGLDRVAGIGPALLHRLAPMLMFGGIPADTLPSGEAGVTDLNTANLAELDALPGIGAARARAIIAFRDTAGPFRQIEELSRVPGISVQLARRLAPRLRIR